MSDVSPWLTTVLLPGGLVLEGNTCLQRAALRPLTGREEDWLAERNDIPNAVKVTELLLRCVVSLEDRAVTAELIRGLLVGDRDYLMLRLRAATLGDRVQAVLRCPSCQAPMDIEFSISAIPIEARPQWVPSYTLALSGRAIRFRLPSGEDQEAVTDMTLASATTELLKRCLLDDGGGRLDEMECEAVAAEMERLAPQVELELDLHCPECSHAFLTAFDTTAFFLEEMRVNHQHLLREFHTLAFHYHWNERDIAELRRDRRRAYLGILSEALRRD